QCRLLLAAARHDMRATRMEAAARRRVQGTWHLAGQDDLLLLLVGVARQGSREQRLGVGMFRITGEGARLTLPDDLAEIRDRAPAARPCRAAAAPARAPRRPTASHW